MPSTTTQKHPVELTLQTLYLRENNQPYIPHDLLFKDFLKRFFEPFIEGFFPELYAAIDFKTAKFISEEVIPDAFKAKQGIPDIVVKAKLKATGEFIIIHVEPQSYQEKNFNERMFYYHSLLYAVHRKPIIPIALLTYDAPGFERDFKVSTNGKQTVQFDYDPIHLKSLYWQDFAKVYNPVTATLMALMRFDKSEEMKLKETFLKIIKTLKLSETELGFLYRFFNVYLPFPEEEVRIIMEKMKSNEETYDISQFPNPFIEYGKSVGRAEGREEGKAENKEEIALNLLAENLSIDLIVRTTGLSKDKVLKLKERL